MYLDIYMAHLTQHGVLKGGGNAWLSLTLLWGILDELSV